MPRTTVPGPGLIGIVLEVAGVALSKRLIVPPAPAGASAIGVAVAVVQASSVAAAPRAMLRRKMSRPSHT
jgi:hypothetical protein